MYAPDEQQTASPFALAAAYGGDTTRDRPPCRLRLRSMLGLVVVLGFILWSANVNAQPSSAGREFAKKSTQLLRQFCFDCHANELAEGDVDLERMASDRSFDTEFRTWQKAAAMLEQGKMPPEDSPQPSNSQRYRLVSLIRSELDRFANQQAGDPGPVVMRRLTSAEYNYSIQDLTGLDLDATARIRE